MASLSLPPLSVYYCYDPVDLDFCKALDIHLDPLKRRGWIRTWDDQQIPAGAEREREREAHLHTAHLLILLISADFIASESGVHTIQVALQRHQDGEAVAIPILIRAASWEETDLHILQVLPREQKAIQAWPNQDEIWREVTKELQQVFQTMRQWVFVASSPEDQEFVQQLRQDMISSNVLLWSLEKGQDEEAQRNAMRTASAVILVASPDAPSSSLVMAQLALATDYQRPILVVWARGEDWKTSNPRNWRVQDAIDVRGRSYETARKLLLIRLRQMVSALPPLVSPDPHTEPRNPYKGLHAFTSEDAGDFFGREALIDELAMTIETMLSVEKQGEQQRPLLVIGPSGSGKSSVVMAGLLPRLQTGRILNSAEWIYLDPIHPGTHPLDELAVSLAKQFPSRGAPSLLEDLASDPRSSLHLLVYELVHPSQRKVVLVVDQFEELFTPKVSEKERKHFLDLLVTAVKEPSSPLIVILTLRADFYGRLMQYREFYQLVDKHHISVLPMDSNDLRMVIEQPARLPDVQLTFDGDLVGDLLFEMRGQAGALPLLQFTLDQLFQQRDGHLLSLQAYRKMGGARGALSQYAELTYKALPSDEHRRLARDLFLRLIEPGTTEQDTTRRRAALSEFELDETSEMQEMQETLDRFIKARLLTTDQNRGTTTVEVSHEAVIREWKRLAEWLREAPGDILIQQDLSKDATEWKQHGRPKDRLYRGSQLKDVQAWAKRHKPSMQERKFLRASAFQQIIQFSSIILVVLLLVSSAGFAGGYFFLRGFVTTLSDNNEIGSLRWCIGNAPSGSTIRFAPWLSGTMELTGGSLVVGNDKTLTVEGPGANRLTISGGNLDADIHVSKGATLNLSGLGFENSKTRSYAFLFNEGTLTLSNDVISGNTTSALDVSYGGGIYNRGTLTVQDSTISNNSASGDNESVGGGIDNEGNLTVVNSTFSKNSASDSTNGSIGFGGGISTNNKSITLVSDSTFSDNSASASGDNNSAQGGGIENEGKLTVVNSTFSKNSASGTNGSTGFGGGIENYKTGTVMVEANTFSDNSASGTNAGMGGGIENEGNLTIVNSTFSKNSASGTNNGGQGGAIDNEGKLTVSTSTFSNNEASGGNDLGGGGISFSGTNDSSTIIQFCTIYGNASSAGGGIWIDPTGASSSHLTISNSIITANQASDGPDISGTLISGGYNLLTNATGASGLSNTDQQVTLDNLHIASTLGNNGGPTQTLKLLPGSVAIDAVPQQACSITVADPVSGHTMTITTDQRGDPRPDGSESACDVGAHESS